MDAPLKILTPAKHWQRFLAFILDFVLVFNLGMLLLLLYLLPQKYPGKMEALQTNMQTFIAQKQQGENTLTGFVFQEQDLQMLAYCQNVMMLLYWLYFLMPEVFGNGSSLGKRVFSLKVVKYQTYEPLRLTDYALRAAVKALCIVWLFPVLLFNYLLVFFNKKKQAGHDMLARSIVVEEDIQEENP